jgi:hypothetical protein
MDAFSYCRSRAENLERRKAELEGELASGQVELDREIYILQEGKNKVIKK